MRLSTKIAYNTIIQVLSKLAATGLGLVAVALMTRYLGQIGFGQFTTILTFLSFFAIVADLGLTLITVQMISQPGADEKKVLGNLLGLRLISGVFFLGLAPLVVLFFPYPPVVKLGVAITAASFLFTALNQVYVGLFQKYLRLDKVSIAEVSSRLVLCGAVALAAYLDFGLTGIMLSTVLSGAIGFLLHYVFSRSYVRFSPLFDFKFYCLILAKSWPLAITIFFNMVYLRADTLLLSILPRPSAIGYLAEVGIYGAAYKVIDVLTALPFMFAGVILPILTARWAEKNRSGFNAVLQKSFDLMVVFALPLVVGAQFISRDLMVLVAGGDFAVSGPILRVLIFAVGFIFLGNMFAHAVIAIDRQRRIIGAYIFTALTALAGYLIFIPRFSYFGAAWVTVYSEALIAFASFYFVWRYTSFRPNLNIFLKALAASAVMALALYLVPAYLTRNVLVLVGLAVAAYFPCLFLFRGLTKQDVLDLLNK